MKYTLEEKLKYVRLHLDDGVPIHEIEKKYGLDPSMLKFYCNMYLKWGEQAFKIDWKRRAYTRYGYQLFKESYLIIIKQTLIFILKKSGI